MSTTKVIHLSPQFRITITSDGSSSGSYYFVRSPGTEHIDEESIGINSTVKLGPYNIPKFVVIESVTGDIRYTLDLQIIEDKVEVALTDLADADVLTYDISTGLWKNKPDTGGSGLGGFTWGIYTTDTLMSAFKGYVANNNSSRVVFTLPSSPNIGDTLKVAGRRGAGWKIAQPAGVGIIFGDQATTPGTGGYLASINGTGDVVELVCSDTNEFMVVSPVGNITVI